MYDTANGIVKFRSTRELDPAGVDTRNFVIELDTDIPLIAAWNDGAFGYHGYGDA